MTLLGHEAAGGEVMYERLVDRRAFELELGEILGERQLGDGELVLDRSCLLLANLCLEQIADDALGLVLAFAGGGHGLRQSCLTAIELELPPYAAEFLSF